MNNLPNGGKVVIVDDCFQEVLPLINILNRNAIPIIYYTGKNNELPVEPLYGIRVFFLDLRFSTNIDSKTIVSNACNILKSILGEKNGPYLLIIWSSTGTDYKDDLEKALKDKMYQPEFTLYLSKADYFETKDSEVYSLIDDIKQILEENEIENKNYIMEKITSRIISGDDEAEKVFIPESMDKLQDELYAGLKSAGLLSLFIIWENTIRNSAHKAVNELYSLFPDTIPIDKKLPAMAYYLAKNQLENQFDTSGEKEKLHAALMELHELYTYFYSVDIMNISVAHLMPLNIQKNTDFMPSGAKFNSWKMMFPAYKQDSPGNIYEDTNKTFKFFNLVKAYDDKTKYDENAQKIRSDERLIYIWANINGECETAQNKYPVVRVIPGVLIPCDVYKEHEEAGHLKNLSKANDYIFKEFDPIEYKGENYYLLFNVRQCMFLEKKAVEDLKAYFTLHRKYYLILRQYVASDFLKQGLDLYKSK